LKLKKKMTIGQKMARGFRVESGSPFGVHYFDQSNKKGERQTKNKN
jgi:hypothetical protein